jgi:hypothetical protein
MNRVRPKAVITTNVREHPAVMAWVAVTGRGPVPRSVAVLRERPVPHKGIYRLAGAGHDGGAVFAKRAGTELIMLERTIYERILPELPLTAPRYYGSCLDGTHGWIFLEDVGESRYSRGDAEQQRLVARWVATLHVGGVRVPGATTLPDAGPARYLRQLRAARAKIHACLGRWQLPSSQVDVLVSLLSRCAAVEAQWGRVEAGCGGAPATVVHGDFQPKNVFLRANGDGLGVFPIDWEMTGWGPPAVDLTRIDLATYCTAVRRAWPALDLAAVERLARFGRLLEAIAAVDWECESLRLENAAHRADAVANLADIHGQLVDAARAAQVGE